MSATSKVVELGLTIVGELVKAKLAAPAQAPGRVEADLQQGLVKIFGLLQRHRGGQLTEAEALAKLGRYRAQRAENNAAADAAADRRFKVPAPAAPTAPAPTPSAPAETPAAPSPAPSSTSATKPAKK